MSRQRNWDEILAGAQAGEVECLQVLVRTSEDFATAMSQGTKEFYQDGFGNILMVHKRTEGCDESCVIHNPSDHPMKDFPTLWRADRQLMERVCPHGVGHPDPDHISFNGKIHGVENAVVESVHGCDGCCSGNGPA